MKNILTFLLSLTLCLTSVNSEAQSKEDFLSALSIVLDLDETQSLYQHYQGGSKALILLKPSNRRIGTKVAIQELMYHLRNDDFWDFSGNVQVMTREEAAAQQISERELVTLITQVTDNEIKFIINSSLREEGMFYSGNFTVSRASEDDDWEVSSRDFKTQKNR